MDLEDVFVSAEVMYQTTQRPYKRVHTTSAKRTTVRRGNTRAWNCAHTMSLYETGALSASAISCALALTLRVLIVPMVSLKLLRGRCFAPIPSPRGIDAVLRGCHSREGASLTDFVDRWMGVSLVESKSSSSSIVGNLSSGLEGRESGICGVQF